ncbi:NAD(P)H-dependent amine dehydrogenase family protein [Yinghuangia sp. YIM S10712]|uniref:NAD(P)H-dependent amine dehydrogenase family protein n=1 Tax=Yinghuangia sp. YIM S10712 TaxID=3436930 RepID=UPI003F52D4E5
MNASPLQDQQNPSDGSASAEKPYRVVQWATGNVGTRSLRQIIEHPRMSLVGLYVHSEGKAGRDAGELCGLAETGVTATRDIDEIIALGADCVLYMAAKLDLDEVCRLLASGANVVTTRGEFHRPASMEPDMRKRVEAACAEGGTSIHSTGSSPGFITETVPLALLSMQRRVDSLSIHEFADVSTRDSPDMLFHVMGFGKTVGDFSEARLTHARTSFGPSLANVADALSLPIETLEASGEVALTTRDVEIAAGTVPKGTVGAQRITVAGLRDGKELVRFTATWYCTTEIDKDWELRSNGWRVVVDGDASMTLDLMFPKMSFDVQAQTTPGYTANPAVNAVPYVIAAEPGIRTAVELPKIVPTIG